MATPEFIFLNGQAARVTSLTPDPESPGFTLVLIARGTADRDQLTSLLNDDDLSVRLGADPEQHMRTTTLDIRSTGEGSQAIHRLQATLKPIAEEIAAVEKQPDHSIEDRLASLEDQLDRIIALLTEIRDQK